MSNGRMYASVEVSSVALRTTAIRVRSPVTMSPAPSCRIARPRRGARRAEANEADRKPIANGRKRRPAARGGRSSPLWRDRHEPDPAGMELRARRCARFPDQPPGEGNGDDAEGEVYEKYRPPPKPEQVGAEQQTAEQLACDHPEPDRHAVHRVGETLLPRRERHLNERERLRDHDGGEGSLQQTGSDQRGRRAGEAAQRGRDGEACHTDHVHPPATVEIAETPSRNQQYGERQRIPRHDQLDLAEARPQPPLNGWDGNGDDIEVERREEYSGQHHGQRVPAPRVDGHGLSYCRQRASRSDLAHP